MKTTATTLSALLILFAHGILVAQPEYNWHTFFGGSYNLNYWGTDASNGIATDAAGAVYVIGDSEISWGSPVRSYSGNHDIFVAKFSASGALIWNTFLGSGSHDYGADIAVDENGNIYIIGTSNTSWGSPIQSPSAGSNHIVVAKLNTNGVLQWNTFLGNGSLSDEVGGIALDRFGNIFASCMTESWGTPLNTVAGSQDICIAKLNSSGILQWHRYLNSTNGSDTAGDMITGWSGAVFVTGSYNNNIFVAKIGAGGSLSWLTTLAPGQGNAISWDNSGNIVGVGTSQTSWGNPIRDIAYNDIDAFVYKLTISGSIQWHTYVGGPTSTQFGTGITVDHEDHVYVLGRTDGAWGYDNSIWQYNYQVFLAMLQSTGTLAWNNSFGDITAYNDDEATDIAYHNNSCLYITGVSPADWPTPLSPISSNKGHNGFIVKYDINRPPVSACQDKTISIIQGCSASISIDNGSYDPDNDQIVLEQVPAGPYPVGTTSVTLTVRDEHNASSTCSGLVTIVDAASPVANQDPLPTVVAECSATISSSPTATDNCAGSITGTTTDPLSYTTQGTYTVTWAYDDGNGNTTTQMQTVIVDDVTNPVPDAPTLATVTGECSATIQSAPTATDNCAGTVPGTTSDPLTYSTQGKHTVTWTYDDGNGNTTTQTQTVLVDDVTDPVPDVTALAAVTGECSATIQSAPTATDNCAGSLTGTTSDPLTYTTQGTYTVSWTYDDGNGNTTTQMQTVIVDDVSDPVPDQATLPTLSAESSVTVTATPTATDNCVGSITGTTSDPLTYTTVGTHIITWTYDDNNGNTSTQTQTVEVLPPTPTVTITGDDLVALGYGTETATLTATAADGTPPYSYTWSTNQTGSPITVSPTVTTTYTVTVTDYYNKTATAQFTVTVVDWRCGNNQNKVSLCHNGHTICVAQSAVAAHLAHGDALGGCQSPKRGTGEVSGFSLAQNYPNPFNPTTTIEFGIPSEGDVRLRVIDLLGREVTVLVKETKQAGAYAVEFDATNHPSGTYVYQLEWNGQVITRRMTLMK